MRSRFIFILMVMAKLVTAGDESGLVRERENAVAKALIAKDKVALSTLTDKDFNFHWRDGSAFRNVSTELGREDWIDELIRLRIASYEAVISKVDLVKPDQAFVDTL